MAKADNKPIDDNSLNLTESNISLVKARNLWFTVFEPASTKTALKNHLSAIWKPTEHLVVFAVGVGFENGKLHILFQKRLSFRFRPNSVLFVYWFAVGSSPTPTLLSALVPACRQAGA
jgi:hypothetical protein